jgi:hypothetical protein
MPITLKGGGIAKAELISKQVLTKVVKQEENPYKLGGKFIMSYTVS